MPVQNRSLKERLSKVSEITITVVGRKTGRKSSRPVWFVLEADDLHLLPVEGSKTQWYQNISRNPSIEIEADRTKGEFKAIPVTEPAEVASVAEKFRAKYGAGDVKKYYSRFDVAVLVPLR